MLCYAIYIEFTYNKVGLGFHIWSLLNSEIHLNLYVKCLFLFSSFNKNWMFWHILIKFPYIKCHKCSFSSSIVVTCGQMAKARLIDTLLQLLVTNTSKESINAICKLTGYIKGVYQKIQSGLLTMFSYC